MRHIFQLTFSIRPVLAVSPRGPMCSRLWVQPNSHVSRSATSQSQKRMLDGTALCGQAWQVSPMSLT